MKKILVVCIVMSGVATIAKPSIKQNFMKRLQKKAEKIKAQSKNFRMDAFLSIHAGMGNLKMKETIFKQGKNIRVDTTFLNGGASRRMPAMFANMKTVTIKTPKGTWVISPMGTHKVKTKGLPPGLNATDWITRISSHIGKVTKISKGYLVELKNTGKWSEALFSNDLDIIQMIGQNTAEKTLKIVFSDYSNAGGVHLPRHLTSFMGKNKIFDMKITKIIQNQSLSPALFDPDKVKVKPMSMPK